MDVPLPCLGARFQNLWEEKKDKDWQKDKNIELFFHAETLRNVVRRSHRIHIVMVHRYMNFVIFQDGAHNMILEPKKDLVKQAHNVGFMITNTDVDDIVKEFPEEWHNPLAKPLPEHLNKEDPPMDHNDGHDMGQGNEGGDDQGN